MCLVPLQEMDEEDGGGEAKEAFDVKRKALMRRSKRLFGKVLELGKATGGGEDDWLCHYYLGKIAEKENMAADTVGVLQQDLCINRFLAVKAARS